VTPRKGQAWPLLLVLVVAGAYLRFHMLGVRSLWGAECFSILVARQPWPRFLRTMWWGEGNMAFYYFLLRGWLRLGDSEIWLQSLSAIFGVIAIPAVYALGNRFLSRRVGLVAAGLFAIHSFHIEHSEELRSYSLLVLLVILSTYALLAVLDSPHRKAPWLLYVLFSTLALYTQFFAIFVLFGEWLALIPRRIKRVGAVKLLWGATAIGVLAGPIAAVMLLRNQGQLDWIPRPSFAGVSEVFRSIIGAEYLGSQNLVASMLLSALYVVTWIMGIWELLRTRRNETEEPMTRTTVALLAWWLVFPVAAMTGISFLKPILYPRYVLMCVPAAVLLAGQGLITIERKVPRGRLVSSAALLIMIALAFAGTRRFDMSLATSGYDWRGVTRHILTHAEPGDAVIFYISSGNWAFEYYIGREHEATGQGATATALYPLSYDRATIENRTEPYRRIWLVLHQDIPTAEGDRITKLLRETLQTRFRLIGETEFAGAPPSTPGENGKILLALYASAPPQNSP
jgi:mannosyltransferase